MTRKCPPDCGPASRAIESGEWSWVSGWLAGRLGIAVTADWVEANTPKLPNGSRVSGYWYSDGSWETWFKSRMRDQGMFGTVFRGTVFGRLTCELHVGFLSLEESAEHMENLRREDKTKIRTGPDTPGIERREATKGPVNRTAARVMPKREKQS